MKELIFGERVKIDVYSRDDLTLLRIFFDNDAEYLEVYAVADAPALEQIAFCESCNKSRVFLNKVCDSCGYPLGGYVHPVTGSLSPNEERLFDALKVRQ